MKILFYIILLFPAIAIAGNNCFYKTEQSVDSAATISFIEVKEKKGVSAYTLFSEISNYFATSNDLSSIEYSDSLDWIKVRTQSELRTNLVGAVGHPKGLLDYSITVQIKDGKYRCIFDDLFYTPMKRNRYGIFELMKSRRRAVNTDNFKPTKSTWKDIYKLMSSTSFETVNELDAAIMKIVPATPEKTNNDW